MDKRPEKRKRPPLVIPLCIGILLSALTLVFHLDVFFSDVFYDPATGCWALDGFRFERIVFNVAPVPAFVGFGAGLLVALGSIWIASWRRWWRHGLFLALCMLLGPGLVVNGIFKEFYGRPRPRQVVEYGGSVEFCPLWVLGETRQGKSFPCGHASIGFYFMAPYFIYYRRRRGVARAWLTFGLLFGIAVGVLRMAKGGHWYSDVVWSGVFVYYTSYLSAWICGLLKDQENAVSQA